MAIVEVKNIYKSYDKGKVKALQDISLSVDKGELYGLIGPDGAGKTTLIRIIASLLIADSGSATLAGFDVVTDYLQIRSIIGYMPGKFSLYQDLSVEENLQFFATVFNTTIKENFELIKDLYVQLEPFKSRRAGKLSGGMKQKLALCCALIHEPKVLLLDEPTTGVDPVSRKEFWEMLIKLKAKGITIIVSTPYMDEAAMCDRISLIQNGKILETGTPAAVTKYAAHKIYAVKAESMYELMKSIRLYPSLHSCYAFGDSHHVQLEDDDIAGLTGFLEQQGINDTQIKEIAPGIEDIFMEKNESSCMNAIEVKDLTKTFGAFTAVDHITFDVKKGEIFGFLGANGAGKTTAMRMLCGLLLPSSGSGTVAGYDIATQSEDIKKNIGYMSQKFSLYNDLTVRENIRFYGGLYDIPSKELKLKSEALLERLGLTASANKLLSSLPLGWKQKLAFSVAIQHKPSIVFLDEPTGGVDPITRRQFWDMIYEASNDGLTVFATTHYMDEAEYCHRVSIMVDGQIAALDTPTALKEKYESKNMDEVFRKLARKAVRGE